MPRIYECLCEVCLQKHMKVGVWNRMKIIFENLTMLPIFLSSSAMLMHIYHKKKADISIRGRMHLQQNINSCWAWVVSHCPCICVSNSNWERAHGGSVGWGIGLQAWRSRVRFTIVSLQFSLILPIALWFWC